MINPKIAAGTHPAPPTTGPDRPKRPQAEIDIAKAARQSRRMAVIVAESYARFLTAAVMLMREDLALAVHALPAGLQADAAKLISAMKGTP